MRLKSFIYSILVITVCLFGSSSFAQDSSFENLITGFNGLVNFGYNFFEQDSSIGFSETGPINPDYRVRTGDEVVIDVWGDLDFHYVLPTQVYSLLKCQIGKTSCQRNQVIHIHFFF